MQHTISLSNKQKYKSAQTTKINKTRKLVEFKPHDHNQQAAAHSGSQVSRLQGNSHLPMPRLY